MAISSDAGGFKYLELLSLWQGHKYEALKENLNSLAR